jgi:hypothetical protein
VTEWVPEDEQDLVMRTLFELNARTIDMQADILRILRLLEDEEDDDEDLEAED